MKSKCEQETLVTLTGFQVYTTDMQDTFMEPAIQFMRHRLQYHPGSQPPLQRLPANLCPKQRLSSHCL